VRPPKNSNINRLQKNRQRCLVRKSLTAKINDPFAGSVEWFTAIKLNNGEWSQMTVQARVAELEQRHHDLEKKIAEALKHNSVDDLEIVELKRQKLHLKDEIERLQHGAGGNK
jgi:hypothetical protein